MGAPGPLGIHWPLLGLPPASAVHMLTAPPGAFSDLLGMGGPDPHRHPPGGSLPPSSAHCSATVWGRLWEKGGVGGGQALGFVGSGPRQGHCVGLTWWEDCPGGGLGQARVDLVRNEWRREVREAGAGARASSIQAGDASWKLLRFLTLSTLRERLSAPITSESVTSLGTQMPKENNPQCLSQLRRGSG